jgi:hypothetical protein
MVRKYFINVEKLKQLGMIELNVESGKLSNILYRCQERDIKPILGKELYDKLLQDIEDNDLSGDYLTLVDEYIIDYLVASVEKKSIFHINMKIREKGTGRSNDEYVGQSNLSADNDLRDELSKDKTAFKRNLVEYLEASDFPEYKKCKIAQKNGSNSTPMFSFITRNR